MKINKRILNNIVFHSLMFKPHKKKYMLVSGWSLLKKDWWYDKDPSTAKFFDIRKTVSSKTINYGIYIGRLGLVFMKEKK